MADETPVGVNSQVGAPSLPGVTSPVSRPRAPVAPWILSQPVLSPPEMLVRLCARRSLSADHVGELVALGRALDRSGWEHVIAIAVVNGLIPLVYWHTAHAELTGTMPQAVASDLLAGYRHSFVTNRHLQAVQCRVLAALAASGIEAVPVKGASLAYRYYGDPALRPANDVDILVRRRDWARADRALRGLGFRPLPGADSPRSFDTLVLATTAYESAPNGARLELHWELPHHPAYRHGLELGGVFSRARIIPIDGQMIRCLDPEDELRYLAVHCTADHGVGRLIWLVDIAEIVRALPPDWKWADFVSGTVAAGMATPVLVALAHCQASLGLEVPQDVFSALAAAARSTREARAFATNRADYFGPVGLRLHLDALTDPLSRALFLWHVLRPQRWLLGKLYGSGHRRYRLPWTYLRHVARMLWFSVRPDRA